MFIKDLRWPELDENLNVLECWIAEVNQTAYGSSKVLKINRKDLSFTFSSLHFFDSSNHRAEGQCVKGHSKPAGASSNHQ